MHWEWIIDQTEIAKALVNGVLAREISLSDRGLMYGDGVFETMACVGGQISYLDRHLERLERGCEVLGLSMPDRTTLTQELARLGENTKRCVLKLIVTRGTGGRGYAPPEDGRQTTRIVLQLPWPKEEHTAAQGLRCDILQTHLGTQPLLAGIKHLNRLEQVLAAREVRDRQLDEGLLCNADGFLVEAVSANVLLVFGDAIVTPPLDAAGVRGVMREVVIERLAAEGTEVTEQYLFSDSVYQADEILLTNSIRGIRRVGRVGETRFTRRTVFDRIHLLINEGEPDGQRSDS